MVVGEARLWIFVIIDACVITVNPVSCCQPQRTKDDTGTKVWATAVRTMVKTVPVARPVTTPVPSLKQDDHRCFGRGRASNL